MNGTSKELMGVYKESTPISSIYNGDLLVWGGNKVSKLIRGKFIDSSTESDWYYYKEGEVNNSYKVPINVDSNTKEFELELEDGILYSHQFCYTQLEYITINYDTTIGSLTNLFKGCENLIEVDMSECKITHNTSMFGMFSDCSKLKKVDLSGWHIEDVENVQDAFCYCKNLTTIKFGYIDFINLKHTNYMFFRCNSLTDVSGTIKGLMVNIDLSDSPLTNDSAMVFINGLEQVDTAKTITFKASTYNTLTDEQIAIATSKGWTIAKV